MKTILILLITFSLLASANGQALLEVKYRDRKVTHQYTLVEVPQKSEFKLTLEQDNRSRLVKTLSNQETQPLLDRVRRLIWDAPNRKANQRCTEYATIRTAYDEAVICQESPKAVGRVYSFLHELHGIVSRK